MIRNNLFKIVTMQWKKTPNQSVSRVITLYFLLFLWVSPFRVLQSDPSFFETCNLYCEEGQSSVRVNGECVCRCHENLDCVSGYVPDVFNCGCVCARKCDGLTLDLERCICIGIKEEIREIFAQTNEINSLEIIFDDEEDEEDNEEY